jgi:mannonate dehydratase
MKYQKDNLKIGCMINPDISDGYLNFMQQIGINYCYTWIDDKQRSVAFISGLRKRLELYGIKLYNVGNMSLGKSASIHLGLEDRDEQIERFCDFLKILNESGIHTTTITWEPNNTVSTSPVTRNLTYAPEAKTRGGAKTRMIDSYLLDNVGLSHKREYSKEEIWDNFLYFMEKVIPTAEEQEVRIALHPNDPPIDSLMGIATLIQCSDDYRKAFSLIDSDFFGMEFCCGCWLEGGCNKFGNINKDLDEFIKKEKVFIIHFRNVSGMLPTFVETFLNDGYGRMDDIMATIIQSGYAGTLVLDHSPQIVTEDGKQTTARMNENAYSVGYIQGLAEATRRVL